MKSLLRIQHIVYSQPWMVLPSTHETIRNQLTKYMASPMPEMPEMPEDEEFDYGMPNVAIILVEGIIGKHLDMLATMCGGVDVDCICDQIEEAAQDENITDIVMYFNTPGGTVTGVPEVSAKIAEISKEKRCTAFVDVLCASAGYYMASQCSNIYCSPSSTIGSIGVYSIYLDQSVALANEGIKVNAISAGKYKLMGAEFKQMTDDERAMIQADTDVIYNDFKAAVLSNRSVADEDMQGQCFTGVQAVEKGLADGNINSLSELLELLTGHQN